MPLESTATEAAAQILQFLYHWATLFESRYDAQLRRYYEDPTPPDQLDLFPDTEPPFRHHHSRVAKPLPSTSATRSRPAPPTITAHRFQ